MRLWLPVFLTVGLAVLPALAVAQTDSEERAQPSVQNYVLLGNQYYDAGQYDAALIAFKRAVELDEKNVEALYGLARAQLRLRLFSPARTRPTSARLHRSYFCTQPSRDMMKT